MENTSKFSDGLDAFESDQSDIYKGILHLFHPLSQYQGHLPAYRGVAAIDEVPPRIHTKRPLIPTFLSNDNEVERRFAERARNQITPPLFLGPASPSRFDISTCSYKWKRNAMENRHDMPLSSPLPFLPSILISISRIPSSNRSTFIPHFIFPIVSDLSKIPFNRYHSTMSLCLLLSSFSYLFPFFRYSNHSFPQDPPQFLDFCSILLSSFSLLSFSLFNFSSPKIPI